MRGAVCFLVALGIAGAPAFAQSVAQGVQSLDRYQAEQERLRRLMETRPKAYEDKVMDPSELPPATDTDAPPSADQEGVRSLLSETRVGGARSGGDGALQLRSTTELGQRIAYRQETLNYGDYSLEVDVRHSSNPLGLGSASSGLATEKSSARITLRNIGLPITERLFADTSVGDISSEVTNALARAYRLSLGTTTLRGASTRVFDAVSDTRAGAGIRGILTGGPYPGFERTQGETAWLGHSRRFGNMVAGAQMVRATDVPVYTLTAPPGLGTANVTSLALGAGYGGDQLQDGGHRGRVIYLQSRTDDGAPAAQGLFLEGSLRLGGTRHEFGAYQAEPGLRYGDFLLAADNRGAYWRMDATSMRLSWGLGVDLEEQNPKNEPGRLNRLMLGLNANAQYRIDRDRFVGGNLNIRLARHGADSAPALLETAGTGARSYYASGFYQTRFGSFGPTRLRATLRRNEVLVTNGIPASGEELEWEQDWITGRYETLRPELTTTLGFARDRSSGATETSPTAGVNFRLWLDADWFVNGNVRYTARRGNLATSRGLSGTIDTEKVLGGGWVAGASVSLNQAVVDIAAVPGASGPTLSRSDDQSAQVYLRWEAVRGQGFQGAGLRAPGSVGAGGIGGIVFFDANRDGVQQSGELGVPNVEVVMDGRYRVSTDRLGRFDFPLVGTGRHQLTLTLETVPLPWGAASDRAVTVDVPLRGQTDARIPVVRVGE